MPQSAVTEQVIAAFVEELSKDVIVSPAVVDVLRTAAAKGTLGNPKTIREVRDRIAEAV